MLLAGIDFETTGLDTKTLHVTEIGACLWSTERNGPVALFNHYVKLPKDVRIPKEIVALNGITDDDCEQFGLEPQDAFSRLSSFVGVALWNVAHNATDFDKQIFHWQTLSNGIVPLERPWIDTSVDVPYPKHISTRKLAHLAAEHGFANPFSHRALFDVMTMMKVLSLYPIHEVIDLARQPMVKLHAHVSYDDKQKAKDRGYRWQPKENIWTKNVKQSQMTVEKAESPFEIGVIQ